MAIASWYLVEEPIRTGRFFQDRRGLAVAGAVALVTAGVVLVATVAPVGSTAAIPASAAGLNSANARRLASGGALTGATDAPVRFLLLGDSVALTAGMGLSVDSVSKYDVTVWTRGAGLRPRRRGRSSRPGSSPRPPRAARLADDLVRPGCPSSIPTWSAC